MHRTRRNPSFPPLATSLALLALLVVACSDGPKSGTLKRAGPTPPATVATGTSFRLSPGELPPDHKGLRLGMSPVLGADVMRRQYAPLTDYLEDALGVPVELVVAASYDDLIDRVTHGDVDVAIMPPASYCFARKRQPDLRLLASQITNGATSYSSFVVVRTDDAADGLEDLSDRRVAFVDARSTSGFLLPYAALLDAGLDPETAFSRVLFTGSHLAAIEAVSEGRADAAATASGMLTMSRRQATSRGDPATADLRILAKVGRVPYDALVASPKVPESGAAKIRGAFTSLSTRTAQGRRVYAGTAGVNGWVPVDDTQYDAVRRVIERVAAHRAAAAGGADDHGSR